MKKGFTLIELLSVIVILSIVSVITIPIVLNVIDDVKQKAELQTAIGVVKSAEYYYADAMFDKQERIIIRNKVDIFNLVDVVNKPDNGIYI